MSMDVAVVGGGVAGACAAIHLARAGRAVTLIERSEGAHHKVCGEFLSAEALDELAGVGLDPAARGAPLLSRVRIAAGGAAHAAALPFAARSLTRRALDEALLDEAQAAGVTVRRGVTARALSGDPGAWDVRLTGGETLRARVLIAATGKHDLRGERRPPGLHAGLVGLKTYYRLTDRAAADLSGTVDVVFFPGGYLGLQPTETGEANACLVVSEARLANLGGDPAAVFGHVQRTSTHVRALLDGAEPTLDRPLAVARVPYGYVRARSEGAYHVGDQAAVIPSFCGEGMGLALRSGRLAAEAVLAGEDARAFQARFARLAWARVKGTALLSRGLARPGVQRSAAALVQLAPGLVTYLASATRTPPAGITGRA